MTYAFPERKSQPGSAERNSTAIQEQIVPLLRSLCEEEQASSRPLRVLEIGSGEGIQLAAIARQVQQLSPSQSYLCHFKPTEADDQSCADVDRQCAGMDNVSRCARLDIDSNDDWLAIGADTKYDVALIFNVIHIVPWQTVTRLFQRISRSGGLLRPAAGRIILYGAFNENGAFTSKGNENFHAYLKAKNADFGLRDIQHDLAPLARQHGYVLERRIEMPAGNLMLIYSS